MESRTDLGIPASRLEVLRDVPLRGEGEFVVYWMTAARRTRFNFALQRAVHLARTLDRPLLVLEPLRIGYRWASDRHHRFVIDGMRANADALRSKGVTYYPYVEPKAGAGRGLIEALGRRACAVITDASPMFFLPRMQRAAAQQCEARLEAVDSVGLLPLSASDRVFARAYDFRRFLQRELAPHLSERPRKDPLARQTLRPLDAVPREILQRWPMASSALLDGEDASLAELDIDHDVAPVSFSGGAEAGRDALKRFLRAPVFDYDQKRNDASKAGTSGLSPYLHYGHVGSHEALDALMRACDWELDQLGGRTDGQRLGWWRMGEAAETFLDQIVTWRELGQQNAARDPEHDSFAGLPGWARQTLEEHAQDARPHTYTAAQFDAADTHDELWNAAQRELRTEGRIHNYLRMLWGKKVLHWSAAPEEAFETLFALNDRYALDGRDPNTATSITWIFGRYDRAWGPERPVFGKVRYMSSDNTRRKMRVQDYLDRWGVRQQSFFESAR